MRQEDSLQDGTPRNPRYYEGPIDVHGDIHQHYRFFTYKTPEGFVSGSEGTKMFTIDRAAKVIWPYFQDFNSWQPNHHYSAAMIDLYSRADRDLGKETFGLVVGAGEPGFHRYQVLKVVPERLIVFYQPIPKDGIDPALSEPVTVSRGFMVFMLNEHAAKTLVTIYMDHAVQTRGMTEVEALDIFRNEKMVSEWMRKWRDDFIPSLKKLVYDRV